jgi:hypothetical protein
MAHIKANRLAFIFWYNDLNNPLAQPAKNEKRAPLIASRVDFLLGLLVLFWSFQIISFP